MERERCQCETDIITTVHGDCGRCGKYTGFCGVGHEKDYSCCPRLWNVDGINKNTALIKAAKAT